MHKRRCVPNEYIIWRQACTCQVQMSPRMPPAEVQITKDSGVHMHQYCAPSPLALTQHREMTAVIHGRQLF